MPYSSKYITASEIGDYVYCKRGWWLRLKNKLKETPAMREGAYSHETLSSSVKQAEILKPLGIFFIIVALILLLAILFL